jgi:PTS system nitrogen regulatory IIA component
MHFGATLKLLRTAAGVSLRGLAAEVGVSPAYLSRVEHGHDLPPTPDRLRLIAQNLGLPEEMLIDLVEELRPDAVEWLSRSAPGRRLAVELKRRQLSPAQLARMVELVERHFPLEHCGPSRWLAAESRDMPRVSEWLSAERVLLGVEVASFQDALQIAALRLCPPRAAPLAAALSQGEPGRWAVGGGLSIPHVAGHTPTVSACLLSLRSPLDLATPDGLPLQAVLVLSGVAQGARAVMCVARAAQLAEPELLDKLTRAGCPEEALQELQLYERRSL